MHLVMSDMTGPVLLCGPHGNVLTEADSDYAALMEAFLEGIRAKCPELMDGWVADKYSTNLDDVREELLPALKPGDALPSVDPSMVTLRRAIKRSYERLPVGPGATVRWADLFAAMDIAVTL